MVDECVSLFSETKGNHESANKEEKGDENSFSLDNTTIAERLPLVSIVLGVFVASLRFGMGKGKAVLIDHEGASNH